MRYRKKPVVIDAILWMENPGEVYEFIRGRNPNQSFSILPADGTIRIQTLEGEMIANSGDWIICGVKGEFYPCKPDIFEQTYEPAE